MSFAFALRIFRKQPLRLEDIIHCLLRRSGSVSPSGIDASGVSTMPSSFWSLTFSDTSEIRDLSLLTSSAICFDASVKSICPACRE